MKTVHRPLLAIVVPVLLVLVLFTFRSAHAQSQETHYHSNHSMTPGAVITVTTTNPNISADGQCSLIEAIVNANNNAPTHADCTAGAGADTIELAANATYEATLVHNTANGPNALPSVTSEIAINGNGSTLQRSAAAGTPLMRLLRVGGAGTLTVNDLTLRNGYINAEAGAGLLNNGGNVTLNDCTVESNTVTNWGGAGATNYYGTMTVNRSLFLENHADSSGMAGGAILHWATDNDATLFVNDSHFISNTVAGGGGAIASLVSLTNNVRTTINGSTFIGNVDSESSDPFGPFGGGALVMSMSG